MFYTYSNTDPVTGVGSTRGSIHFHLIGLTKGTPADAMIDSAISDWALSINSSVTSLNEYIESNYNSTTYDGPPPLQSIQDSPKKAFHNRQAFLQSTDEGRLRLKEYHESIAAAKSNAVNKISTIMEGHFGYNATHLGHAPDQWPKPGSKKIMVTDTISTACYLGGKSWKHVSCANSSLSVRGTSTTVPPTSTIQVVAIFVPDIVGVKSL